MSGPNPEFRVARTDDLPAVIALLTECGLLADDLLSSKLDCFEQAVDAEGRIVGVAGFDVANSDASLHSVAVVPDWRAQGLGEHLVVRREEAAKAAGVPEATPVSEADRLQQDLARAGVEPFAWVINRSHLVSGSEHPTLNQRGSYEIPFIHRVAHQLSRRCALIPWLAKVPVGAAGLKQLAE